MKTIEAFDETIRKTNIMWKGSIGSSFFIIKRSYQKEIVNVAQQLSTKHNVAITTNNSGSVFSISSSKKFQLSVHCVEMFLLRQRIAAHVHNKNIR